MPIVGGIGFQIIDPRDGRPYPEIFHQGKYWVAAKPGEQFWIRLVCPQGPVYGLSIVVDGSPAFTTMRDQKEAWPAVVPFQRTSLDDGEDNTLPGPICDESPEGEFRFAVVQPAESTSGSGQIAMDIYANVAGQETGPPCSPGEGIPPYRIGRSIRSLSIYYAHVDVLREKGIPI